MVRRNLVCYLNSSSGDPRNVYPMESSGPPGCTFEGLTDGTMTRSHTELRSADSSLHHMDLGINPALFAMSLLTCLLKRSSTYSLMIVIALISRAILGTIGEQ
jgi:hypothetical protein